MFRFIQKEFKKCIFELKKIYDFKLMKTTFPLISAFGISAGVLILTYIVLKPFPTKKCIFFVKSNFPRLSIMLQF